MKKNVLAVLIGLAAVVLIGVIVVTGMSDDKKNEDADASQNSTNTSSNSDTDSVAVETSDVSINDGGFVEEVITVRKGTTVTWTNNGDIAHTVTADEGDGPDSALLDTGETYQYTFDTVGTFQYHCAPHPNMTGKVIVTE